MLKKIVMILLSITIISFHSFLSYADENKEDTFVYDIPRMYDYCEKITEEQETLFTKRSKLIGGMYDLYIFGMTNISDDDDPTFAYKMYIQMVPDNKDAVFLYIEQDGTCSVRAFGYITKLFLEETNRVMEQRISEKLEKSGYFEAFTEYLDLCNSICKMGGLDIHTDTDVKTKADTDPVNDNPGNIMPPKKPKKTMSSAEKAGIVVSIVGGMGIAFLSCSYLKKKSCVLSGVSDFQYPGNGDFKFVKTQEKLVKKTIVKNSNGRSL